MAHAKEFKNSLVLFCIPGSEACDIAKEAVGRVEGIPVPAFYFDCALEALLCYEFLITSFPDLALVYDGESADYSGSYQPTEIKFYIDQFFATKDNRTKDKLPHVPKYIYDINSTDYNSKYKRGTDKFYYYPDADSYRDCMHDQDFDFEQYFAGSAVKDLRTHDYLKLVKQPVLFLVADASRNSAWLMKIVSYIDVKSELIEFYNKMAFSFVDINLFVDYVLADFYIYKAPAVVIMWRETYWILDSDPANLATEVHSWWFRYVKY